jgi:predicted porin
MKTFKRSLSVSILLAGLVLTATHAVEIAQLDNTKVDLTGYIKFDSIFSTYSAGRLSAGNLGRDFYVPSLTPVGGDSSSMDTDFSARQSRFGIRTTTNLDNNDSIVTYLEMDFMATPSGDERISNSYSPRLRHAFIKYNDLLVGQTWTTFMNVSALPESVDFIGTTDGTPFVRQAQVRYSIGNFDIAAENPETTLTPVGTTSRIVTDSGAMPDLIARYNLTAGDLSMTIAGIARQLSYDLGNGDTSNTTGFGMSVAGKWMLGADDLRFSVTSGEGLGRYVGLNFTNDAVLEANNELEAVSLTSATIAYRHSWNEQWRSNLMASAIDVDLPDTSAPTASSTAYSARINVMYSPAPKLSFGVEYAFANREVLSGDSGDMNRIQLTAKYAL